MSATERLRELLDERGVEWRPIAWNPKKETFYHTPDGVGFCADEYVDGVKIYTDALITPEQAVAATLGDTDATAARQVDAGTCRDIGGCRWFRCSACGFGIEDMYVNDEDEYPPEDQPRYCPNCGRKVVDE